jgi:hypothetical protein
MSAHLLHLPRRCPVAQVRCDRWEARHDAVNDCGHKGVQRRRRHGGRMRQQPARAAQAGFAAADQVACRRCCACRSVQVPCTHMALTNSVQQRAPLTSTPPSLSQSQLQQVRRGTANNYKDVR